jgi:hypothetical protein
MGIFINASWKTKTKEKSATIIVILPLDVPQWKQKME